MPKIGDILPENEEFHQIWGCFPFIFWKKPTFGQSPSPFLGNSTHFTRARAPDHGSQLELPCVRFFSFLCIFCIFLRKDDLGCAQIMAFSEKLGFRPSSQKNRAQLQRHGHLCSRAAQVRVVSVSVSVGTPRGVPPGTGNGLAPISGAGSERAHKCSYAALVCE